MVEDIRVDKAHLLHASVTGAGPGDDDEFVFSRIHHVRSFTGQLFLPPLLDVF